MVIDYTTQYPEAVLLHMATAPTIATELMKNFARVGISQEIVTNQGTNISLRLMVELCHLLNIQALKTLVFHPYVDGLVERFN